MDSQGRGQLGLSFLVAALIMMPVLVFAYHPRSEAEVSGDSGVSPTPGGSASPATTPSAASAGPAIREVQGLGDGRPLRGTVQLWAFVEGDVGAVLFRVEGAQASFVYVAEKTPYLLDPHDPPIGAWDTTFVPNGEYTLTAISTKDPAVWRSVRFIVRNR